MNDLRCIQGENQTPFCYWSHWAASVLRGGRRVEEEVVIITIGIYTITSLSTRSTEFARERNEMADTRTGLASYRSVLAEIRTELAFVRTGLAFIALGIGMLRYFGLDPWSMLDVGLIVIGAVMTLYGVRSFILTRRNEKKFAGRLRGFLTLDSELEPTGEAN